jgi:NTP pyrophosphatase (non-canonical NTP hydrolase)
MDIKQYEEASMRTMADQNVIRLRNFEGVDKKGNPQFGGKNSSTVLTQLDNAARGMAGDVGEVNTCVQQALEYGKLLDLVNLKEELGDVLWRIVQACNAVGFTLEEVMQANISKLAIRYPDKYTDHLADEANRNREAERQAITVPQLGEPYPVGHTNDGGVIVEPMSPTRTVMSQTGQGWAEPKEQRDTGPGRLDQELEYPVSNAFVSAADAPVRRCRKCGLKIHRNQPSDICSSCFKPTT